MLDQSTRFTAILKGTEQPKDPAEGLAFAQLAHDQKYYAVAARLWSEGLVAQPQVAEDRQNRMAYSAACAAALAADGKGKEAQAEEPARLKLRSQAFEWLKAELGLWTNLAKSGQPDDRTTVVEKLRHWKKDPGLASIRDPEPLAKLPEAERKDWQALWAEVDDLIARAAKP